MTMLKTLVLSSRTFAAAPALAVALLLGATSLALSACDSKAPPTTTAIPAGLVERKASGEATPLGDLMKTAKVGDTVRFSAMVAGRADPFVPSRAMMLVADPRLLPCNKRPDDHCATPADLCCETAETLRANVATVQLVDAKGRPFEATLVGVGGLAALSNVVVEGTLIERGDAGGFVINATRVEVQPSSPDA